MKIQDFQAFKGEHCETTATGTLLMHIGIDLSEPMLFGLGEGLSYVYWKMKCMESPFLGGRIKPDVLTENICNNLNLELCAVETSSLKKAWKNVASYLDQGIPVGLKLDCYHLDYFSSKFHFGGHYVAIHDYDDEFAYLVDTLQQGGMVNTTLENLALARNEKGPMTSRNRSYTINKTGQEVDMRSAIKSAIHNNTEAYLNPAIKNLTYKGIYKTSGEIKKWFANWDETNKDFALSGTLMEKGGTGGAIFRNLYRDFLRESAVMLESTEVNKCADEFAVIAKSWNRVAELFTLIGKEKDETCLNEACALLKDISNMERITMEKLAVAMG